MVVDENDNDDDNDSKDRVPSLLLPTVFISPGLVGYTVFIHSLTLVGCKF